MNLAQSLSALEAHGTAQNRKIYARHGVSGPQYGVSRANLKKLKKQIKKDHALALALWEQGNHDARILATLIADPKAATVEQLEAWMRDADNYVETDALAGFIARTRFAEVVMANWINTDSEWTERTGWLLLAHVAMDAPALPDDYFKPYLATIEVQIHQAKNRVRDAMNNALIAIGIRNATLEGAAMAVAERVGQVSVDHGETSCKTPEAGPYIQRTWARKRKTS